MLKKKGVHINSILFQHDSAIQHMIVEVLDLLVKTFRQKFISLMTGQEWSPLNHIDFLL